MSVIPPTSPASWKMPQRLAGVLGGLDDLAVADLDQRQHVQGPGLHRPVTRGAMERERLAIPVLGGHDASAVK